MTRRPRSPRTDWTELARRLVVEIAGDSMAPSLPRGFEVRVAPIGETPTEPGSILLMDGSAGLYVHRLVGYQAFRSGPSLFHMGDATGCVGLARREAVIGEVVAVLHPSGTPLPKLERVEPRVKRRFERARRRCSAYGLVRLAVECSRLGRWLPARAQLHQKLFTVVVP